MTIDPQNILPNPTLKPAGDNIKTHLGSDGEPHFIYSPLQWLETFAMATLEPAGDEPMPDTNHPGDVCSVLPRNGYMAIELNNRRSLSRFATDALTLDPGKYAFKYTRFDNDLRWEGGTPSGNDSIMRRGVLLRVSGAGAVRYPQEWHTDPLFGRQEVVLMYVRVHTRTSVGMAAEVWNRFGNLLGDEMIESIQCIRLAEDYSAPWVEVGDVVTPPPPIVVPPTPRVDFPVTAVLFTLLGIVIALVLVGLAGRPVSAQALDVPIISIEEAAAILLSAIAAIVAGAGQSVFVAMLVPLFKLAFKTVSAPVLTLGAAVLITVVVWVSRVLGMEAQLNTLFDLLKVVLPPLVALLTSLFGAKTIYAMARRNELAYIGYQRTPPNVRSVARRSPKIVPLPTEYVDSFER